MDAYPPLLQDLLRNRGITTADAAAKFLAPDYVRDTHDPFLMKDMDRVVERIIRAVNTGERIVIFSDYDADGIPGAVVLHDFFKKIGFENFQNYIPLRHEEGFGLNKEAITELASNGAKNSAQAAAKLLITIDCGITDVEPVAHAKNLGLEVIITDHHEPLGDTDDDKRAKLPPAYAILNPKQPGCAYPEKMLCGSGVIFKLVQALLARKQEINLVRDLPADRAIVEGWEKWLLDMVGLATLSDMVPLTGENRAFAFYGLQVLRKSPRLGLMKLIRKAGAQQRHITEDDIGFTITPRINAASRMGIPMDAFTLLSTRDEIQADVLADHLNKKNDERKGMVAAMTRDINKRLEERVRNEALREVIVMGNPEWKPSLLGLVANALKDTHSRPVFLWGRESASVIKGSCRSDGSVSVVALMEEVRPLLLAFGGHKMSGGFSMEQEHVHIFEDRLAEAYRKLSTVDFFADEPLIDRVLSVGDVSWNTWSIIERLGPFGVGNPKPVFKIENARVVSAKQFGKEKNHVEVKLEDARSAAGTSAGTGRPVTAISFFKTVDSFSRRPVEGETVSLIGSIEKSTFRNYPELRLRIIDIV